MDARCITCNFASMLVDPLDRFRQLFPILSSNAHCRRRHARNLFRMRIKKRLKKWQGNDYSRSYCRGSYLFIYKLRYFNTTRLKLYALALFNSLLAIKRYIAGDLRTG
jgi:hypothetical protein